MNPAQISGSIARGDTDWRTHATCTPATADLFFADPDDTDAQAAIRVDLAKSICARCPVRRQCLNGTTWEPGIRGGLTAAERRTLAGHPSDRVAVVRHLAATGMPDTAIADRVERSTRVVSGLRRANGIPAGRDVRSAA